MINFVSGDGVQNLSKAAGTRIQVAVGGLSRGYTTVMTYVDYTPGANTHVGTIMRGMSRSSVVNAVAAGSAVITTKDKLLDADGTDIAVGDVICAQLDDGTWYISTVSALDATKTVITAVDNVATGRTIPTGAKIVNYGVAADAYHVQHTLPLTTGATYKSPIIPGYPLCKAPQQNEPLVLDVDNVTAAGTLNHANVGYTSP